jgi:DNA-binding NarL/FixJ family response regulator
MSKRPLSHAKADLTERQMAVARLVAQNATKAEIARLLGIRMGALESHINAIKDKWLLGSDVQYPQLAEIAKEKVGGDT